MGGLNIMNTYHSLKDLVYNYIADLINDGELSDDHKVNEQRVCDALDVSRTPVREALIQLSADGYLENVPRRGFYVKRMTVENAREIMEVVGPLDGRAALLAVKAVTEEDIAQMKFLHGSMQIAIETGLFDKYSTLQSEFHDCYVQKCGNQKLVELIGRFRRFFIKGEHAGGGEGDLKALLLTENEEHAQIVRLFEEGDGEGLQRFIRDVHWGSHNAQYFAW